MHYIFTPSKVKDTDDVHLEFSTAGFFFIKKKSVL